MVSHWDSSKRPLYVKTVWRDGQHHVLLNDQQTPKQPKKSTKKYPSEKRPIKSAPLTNYTNLNVSSVRILNTDETKSTRRCKTGVKKRLKTAQKLTFNCQEVSNNLTKELQLNIKSNTLEIDIKEKYTTNDNLENINDTCLDLTNFKQPQFNSLTERVLMWLDLATQNGDFPNYINLNPDLEYNNPQPAFKKRQRFAKQRCFSSYQANCDYKINNLSFHIEGTSQALQLANSARNHNSTFEEDVIKDVEEDSVEENLVSSRLEEVFAPEEIVAPPSEAKMNYSVKRQLHIFLPDLKKRIGFCDSDLSSQLSTCTLQKSDNGREI